MTWAQVLVVAITVMLNALDGFDVLSISFASPGIAREWGIDRAALGIVLSMELLGMSIGSIVIGGLADRLGRRYTLLGCSVVMTFGMAMILEKRSPKGYVRLLILLLMFTPFIRRLSDWTSTYTDPSPMLVAPLLAP